MTNEYPWIFKNNKKELWEFYLNNNDELIYKIIYAKESCTEEKVIDTRIIEFAICIEEETIHILYVNKKNEMRYCTRRDGKWIGEKVYDIKRKNNFEVRDLKTVLLNGKIHIFYLLASVDNTRKGILQHCVWNGKDVKLSIIQYITLSNKTDKFYEIQLNKKNSIDIFFISYGGQELSLNWCTYNKNSWTRPKRLYGIRGDNILFKTLNTPYAYNIINRIKEKDKYFLKHVRIEENVSMKEYEIYKGDIEPVEPIMFCVKDRIFTCWYEKNNVFYSEYDFGKWQPPININEYLKTPVRVYNFLNIRNACAYMTYGIEDEELYILNLENFIENNAKMFNRKKILEDPNESTEDKSIEEIKNKFRKICYENSILKEKIDSFSITMKKKKFIVKDYENKLNRAIEERNKLREHCNFFMEIKQNIQNELDDIKKQLDETRNELEKQKIFTNNMKSDLNKKDKDNKFLKKQIDSLLRENIKLKEELDFERNRSLVTKLFKKKE